MKYKKILVTGGAGYVGAVLIPKLLGKEYKVTVFDWYLYGEHVFNDYQNNRNLNQIKGDIRNQDLLKEALNGIDTVIHLACISNDPSFELDPKLGKSVNYDATIKLVDFAKEMHIKRFIYASSSSVYGVKQESEVTEDLPLVPLTDYSKYKALSEKYILSQQSSDFIPLILRPATVCGYSPRFRLDLTVNILTLQALINHKITVFGGSQLRPNIHIEDMTDLYVKTLEYPDEKIAGKIFNAGYENYSLQTIAEMVKKALGDESIEITTQLTSDLRSYKISSRKIRDELKFRPTHTVENAIQDLKNAYLNGKIVANAFDHDLYFNIKTMKQASSNL